jgi:N-acetylneuraminate synthase/N,N'-diacetyllegionaminate synthase
MSNLQEIKDAVDVIQNHQIEKNKITILHCNTEYPTPMQDVNLFAMKTIHNKLGVKVGYSDHTLGIEVSIAAVALGATIIEKHFTLNRNLPGPDHLASLEPDELKSMVQAIRNIEIAISGNGEKEPSESEINNISIARKSIHIAKDLPNGHIITERDLIALRPGDGISPMAWETIIGKKLTVNKLKFEKLNFSDIK